MQRAIIYNRVSRDEQVENYSLGFQSKTNKEYAEKNNLVVVGEYFEDYTGAEARRPEMDKIIERVYNREFDVLIVSDLDRFARGLVIQIQLEEVLKKNEVQFKTVLNTFSETPEGQLQKSIYSVFAEYERTKIRDRMVRGRKSRAEAGHMSIGGVAKYGYTYIKENRKGRYEINEEEADVVRRIFDMYATGDIGIRKIVMSLTEECIPTRMDTIKGNKKSGYGKWGYSSVAAMLSDESYLGIGFFGKLRSYKNVNTGKVNHKSRPKEERIEISIPSIVDIDLWLKVQSVRERRNIEKPKPTTKEFLLKGHVRCEKCKRASLISAVTNKQKKEYRYYRCMKCGVNTQASVIEDIVWGEIVEIIKNPDSILAAMEDRDRAYKVEQIRIEDRISALQDRMKTVDEQTDKLLDLFLTSTIGKDVLEEKHTHIKEEKLKLQNEITRLTRQTQRGFIDPKQIHGLIETISKGIDLFGFEQKQKTIQLLEIEVMLDYENKCLEIKGLFIYEATKFPKKRWGAMSLTRAQPHFIF